MRRLRLALWLLLGLLATPAAAQDLDAVVDALTAVRRDQAQVVVDGPRPVTLEGVATPERGVWTVDAVRLADWQIEGPIRVTAQGRRARRTVAISGTVAARWADLDLGQGPVDLTLADAAWAGTWTARDGVAEIDARWQSAAEAPLVVRVARGRLGALAERWLADTPLARLTGGLEASLLLRPGADGLTGALSVHASPQIAGVALGDLLIDARRIAGAAPEAEIALRGPVGIIGGRATWPSAPTDPFAWSPTAPLALQLNLQSVKLARLSKIWPVLALDGRTYGNLTVTGSARRPRLNTSLLTAAMAWRGEALGRTVVGLSFYDGHFLPSINWDGHTTINAKIPGSLDLAARDARWDHDAPLQLTVRARGLTPQRLRPLWKAHPAADFSLDLDLDANNSLRDLAMRGVLTGQLRRRGHPATALRARLVGTSRLQQIEVQVGDAVLAADWTLRAPLHALRRGTARWADTRVTGDARLGLPLAMLAPYMPRGAFDPRGRLEGQLTTAGTLGAPTFSGAIDLHAGAITLIDLAQRLEDVEAHGTIRQGTLTLDRLTARSGIGALSGQGSISLKATPDDAPPDLPLWSDWRLGTAVQLRADRFPFIHDTLPNGTFDTDVTIDALMQPGETRAKVALRAATVRLTPVRMPHAQAIPHHRAVRSLDWTGAVQTAPSVFAGDGKLTLAAVLEEPVRVEGDGVAMALTGALTIRRDGPKAETEGGLNVQPGGTFRLFDNAFVVQSGGLRMDGGDLQQVVEIEAGHAMLKDPDQPVEARPLEPIIELRAQGQVIDTVVDVAVVGPGRRPELILQSDPPLPEYRILTLLITGRVDAVDERNGDVRRQVAKLVARFHNPSLARQLYDRLGVDKLGLKFGSSVTNPILTVGKQINRQLYLETVYHHDAPPDENEKEVHVEYRLNPRWTLDTVYGDAAKGSVGVFWKTSFGRAKRPAAPEGDAPAGTGSEGRAQPDVHRDGAVGEGQIVTD